MLKQLYCTLLLLQALSYSHGSKTRFLVKLQLYEPASCSMSALLQLKESKAGSSTIAGRAALAGEEHYPAEHTAPTHSKYSSSNGDSDQEHDEPARARGPPEPKDSFNRTSDWVRETSKLPKPQLASPTGQRRAIDEQAPAKGKQSWQPDEDKLGGDETAVYVSAKLHAKGAAGCEGGKLRSGAAGGKHKGKQQPRYSEDEDHGTPGRPFESHGGVGAAVGSAGPGSVAESASTGGGSSNGDGVSEAAGSVTSASQGAGHDEDLAVDARRARRLKKLNRMVQSTAAQQASKAWKRRTLMLLGIVLVAHVACFVVLSMQVDSRYENAEAVSQIADLLAASQQAVLRANFMQKCWMQEFQDQPTCNNARKVLYRDKLQYNTELTHRFHQSLYLGQGTTLRPMKDQRLVKYWTYKHLDEQLVLPQTTKGVNVPVNGSRTLWEMGNVFVNSGRTLHYYADDWQASMVNASAWQYIYNNGPHALYTGYAWTLDTFVDYTWRDLTTLSMTIIVLLVVEVRSRHAESFACPGDGILCALWW
eukprot:GHRQ01028163.1.p1 GENE.GHRQ01028163.1~~GHRQ01028163.1.p1  ORF type:complete len:534 (+),score=138.84 GHRQ01028163.1:97-1698(+)